MRCKQPPAGRCFPGARDGLQPQSLKGRSLGPGYGPVVKVQVTLVKALPARSRINFVLPVTVTVKLVLAARVELGLRTQRSVVPSRVTTAFWSAPVAVLRSVNVVVLTPS